MKYEVKAELLQKIIEKQKELIKYLNDGYETEMIEEWEKFKVRKCENELAALNAQLEQSIPVKQAFDKPGFFESQMEDEPQQNLQNIMDEISIWSDSVFGEHQRNPAIVYHLRKEINELIECFESGIVTQKERDKLLMEFADCMMLLTDSASHAFFTATDLISAMKKKLEINKKRKWGNPDENGVISHIESKEPQQSPDLCCGIYPVNKSQPDRETLREELRKYTIQEFIGEPDSSEAEAFLNLNIDNYLNSKE